MEPSETHGSSCDTPVVEPQQSAAYPTTAANSEPQQAVPLPIEGKRNYGYPDDFMMYSFKVEPCTRTDKHPRGSCPFAHAGDVARRRHPSRHQALLCPEVRAKKACPRLDDCQCSHSAFEFWLHPNRYRTSMCEKGQTCTRPVCFFAHSVEELRPLPEGLKTADPEPGASSSNRRRTSSRPPQGVLGLQPAAVAGAGTGFLQQQQQPQLLMQPGMQLMPLSPVAGAAAQAYAPLGYMPVVQAEAGVAMQYGQMPLHSGLVMVQPNQQQQYVLQAPLQQLQPLEQQFQGLAVASGPTAAGADPSGALGNPWQQQQQQPVQAPQQLMMMPLAGMGATPGQAAVQYPQQQVLYVSSPAEHHGRGAAPQQQQQQAGGSYHPASSAYGGTYTQYGTSDTSAGHSSSNPGFPANSFFAGSPAGLQGGNTMLAGNPRPGLLGGGHASGVVTTDAGGLSPTVPQILPGPMHGTPRQHEGPSW